MTHRPTTLARRFARSWLLAVCAAASVLSLAACDTASVDGSVYRACDTDLDCDARAPTCRPVTLSRGVVNICSKRCTDRTQCHGDTLEIGCDGLTADLGLADRSEDAEKWCLRGCSQESLDEFCPEAIEGVLATCEPTPTGNICLWHAVTDR